ncbi:MAG: bifunctional DNA-formamidopyrimidine glycosylase/DNA-(apurinic or apyrimidinic site) lyase [Gammaproteobacteria bacterium]|nr:bifunctional DNA-formamidopyrimidine glycosylase/DNA-(apurinic or apyrimidinic site) lyase [Gammaproteobacteria bacterium]
MPELPEVETTRAGIAPHLIDRRVIHVDIRQPMLRWPVPADLARNLEGQRIIDVTRRAKYLLLHTANGAALMHLGMSGSLRVIDANIPPQPHDHIDLRLDSGQVLRLRDPRRFGALLWIDGDPLAHPLLHGLGPEPLSDDFDGDYLIQRARGRTLSVKDFIMNSRVVVGVGNIYASESLFAAGIHPARAAGRISRARYHVLALSIKQVLQIAIGHGGTTLRNFVREDGRPGYFRHELRVYGKAGANCPRCGYSIRLRVIGQRSSFYCGKCQR